MIIINKDEKEFGISYFHKFFFPSFDAELFLKKNVLMLFRSNGRFLLKDFLFSYFFFFYRDVVYSLRLFFKLLLEYLRIILFLFTFLSFVLRIISLYRLFHYFSHTLFRRIFLYKKFLRLHHVARFVSHPQLFLHHLFYVLFHPVPQHHTLIHTKSFQKSLPLPSSSL